MSVHVLSMYMYIAMAENTGEYFLVLFLWVSERAMPGSELLATYRVYSHSMPIPWHPILSRCGRDT